MNRQAEFFKCASFVLLVLFFLAGRGYPAEKAKITLAYSTTGPTAVGLWMAKEIGAFDKYGADPNLIFISSSPVMVPALISGDVQGGIAGANAVISAVLGGASIVSVASLANRPYLRLWVQPEINRLEDLRGKTLGVSRFGATTDNLTRILLRKVGLEGGVNIRQLGGTVEVGLAFRHRQIDGAVLATLRTDARIESWRTWPSSVSSTLWACWWSHGIFTAAPRKIWRISCAPTSRAWPPSGNRSR